MEGFPLLKDEIKNALKHVKNEKVVGPDGISPEMIDALEGFGIGKLKAILNKTYDTGDIPVSFSRSIFVTFLKPRNGGMRTASHN